MKIPLKGNTKDTSLVKVLVYLNRNRKTGTLSLTTPVFSKKIYLSSGNAVFASSTYADDRLGEMLLKADKITVEQYDQSVEMLKKTRKRQGAILVELGYITPKDLFWGVKYQVREIIHSMFQVEQGDYDFDEGEIPAQEVITLKMSMGNLIYEGIKRIDNWTRIRNEMPETAAVFRLSDDPLSLFQDIELSSQDKKILSMVDGKKSINQIIEGSWMGSFEALKILYVLWSIGIVELTTEAVAAGKKGEPVALKEILRPISEEEESVRQRVDSVYARLDRMGMDELLEIDASSDGDTVKKNYFRFTKEFHPDRYFAVADDTVKEKLTAIFDAVTSAYESLKDDKVRKDYFKSLERPKKVKGPEGSERAEEQFKRGVEELKRGNFRGAISHLTSATKSFPKNAGYWNHLSLAFSKIPGRLKDAEDALVTAIKLEPSNADFLSNLGLVYLKAGGKKKAQESFEKALKIDPKNEKAQKGLKKVRG
jgi:tetratricopeptide (TPR) repeat protein